MQFIATLRSLSGGKPIGFKLCIGARTEFLSICKAMLQTGITPDFIIVDGAEGGTGAAPQEFEDHVGMPLTEGLMMVHNALVGDRAARPTSGSARRGKVASGVDIVSRICQGADFTMSARAMMFAVGCIQALKCHTNKCPTGVATQDPRRARALYVPDKTERVVNFQRATVASAAQIVASMGLNGFDELEPAMLNRRIEGQRTRTYAEIYEWLMPGELLDDPPESWRSDWIEASRRRVPLAGRREVVEGRVRGVVARDEGEHPGPPWQPGAPEIQAFDRNRNIQEALGAGTIRAHQVGMQQAVTEVAVGRGEHGLHVVGRERDVTDLNVLEIRHEFRDLVDNAFGHFVFQAAVLLTRRFDGEIRRRTHWRRASQAAPGVGSVTEGICMPNDGLSGSIPALCHFPLSLLFFGCAEHADRLLHAGFVEDLVGAANFGKPLSAKCIWMKVARWSRPVRRSTRLPGRCSVPTMSISVRSGDRLEITTRCTQLGPVAQPHTGGPLVVDDDLIDLGAIADFAAVGDEQILQVLAHRTDAALEFGHHHRVHAGNGQGEGQTRRAARRERAAVGGVDGQERQHAPDRRVLAPCPGSCGR